MLLAFTYVNSEQLMQSARHGYAPFSKPRESELPKDTLRVLVDKIMVAGHKRPVGEIPGHLPWKGTMNVEFNL